MVEFVSPEWVRLFHAFVRDGLEKEDLRDTEYRMYELYKDVPAHLRRRGSSEICFGFTVSAGKLEFVDRPLLDATFGLIADYDAMAPWVSLPRATTKSINLLERLTAAGKLRVTGDLQNRPAFMERLNLHDRLAEWTKPYVAKPKWEK